MAQKEPDQLQPQIQQAMRAQSMAGLMRLEVAKHIHTELLKELALAQGGSVQEIAQAGEVLAPLAWTLADSFLQCGQLQTGDLKARMQQGQPRPS